MDKTYANILTTRHPELKLKDSIWNLILDSYLGGQEYFNAGYLFKYPKESLGSFNQRKKRSVYFNQVSPVVDMLSGLLFMNEPTREIPKELVYLQEDTSNGKNINEFMRVVSAYSLMFTCGVLIDSPKFDPDTNKTLKDRKDNNLNPYAVLYLPMKIRDFYVGDNYELEWVILDNSYYLHDDPFLPGREITIYRLWTREYYQDFTYDKYTTKEVTTDGQIPHSLGIVPFRFVSWRDDNNDFIGETIFEDIAMISRLIYNSMSYMDEMLASGTFKVLMYPTDTGTLPDGITNGGIGALSAIPYNGNLSGKPFFDGAQLQEVEPFIKAMEFYMSEILKKVGLSTDETKEFVKSGAAKKVDYQKMRALLISGAQALQKTERWMFETAAKWEGKNDQEVETTYNSAFSSEDLKTEVQLLTELLIHPVASLRKNVMNLLVKKLLSNDLKADTLKEIYADIEKNITANTAESTKNPAMLVDTRAAAEKINKTQRVAQANPSVKTS